jgi:hypothetical protein
MFEISPIDGDAGLYSQITATSSPMIQCFFEADTVLVYTLNSVESFIDDSISSLRMSIGFNSFSLWRSFLLCFIMSDN